MKKQFFFVVEKKSSENSDLAFTPGIEMQFLLMPCFCFQRTRLKSNFHSRFNLAAAVSRLAIIAIIKCNYCDLRNLKIQTAWRSTCVCNCIKLFKLISLTCKLQLISFFVSRSRLVCCRNATSAAMSPIKISTEKMCFLVAENTSVFESAENTSVFESVGQSSWAAAQSRVCSLFPSFLATQQWRKVHRMQSLWFETCYETRRLRKHVWNCIHLVRNVSLSLTCFFQANKQGKQENNGKHKNSRKPIQTDIICLTPGPWW